MRFSGLVWLVGSLKLISTLALLGTLLRQGSLPISEHPILEILFYFFTALFLMYLASVVHTKERLEEENETASQEQTAADNSTIIFINQTIIHLRKMTPDDRQPFLESLIHLWDAGVGWDKNVLLWLGTAPAMLKEIASLARIDARDLNIHPWRRDLHGSLEHNSPEPTTT